MHGEHRADKSRFRLTALALLGTLAISGCIFDFDPGITVTYWDPEKAYEGFTAFNVNSVNQPRIGYVAYVDMSGQIVWDYRDNTLGPIYEIEHLADNSILNVDYASMGIRKVSPQGEVVWMYEGAVHHDVNPVRGLTDLEENLPGAENREAPAPDQTIERGLAQELEHRKRGEESPDPGDGERPPTTQARPTFSGPAVSASSPTYREASRFD